MHARIRAMALVVCGLGVTPVLAADAALVAAAKKEGRLTWYTVQIVDQIVRPIAEAFERKYGIHVDFARANSAEIGLRVVTEARGGKVQASIFDGAQTTPVLKREGLVAKWVPDVDLPKNLFDPDGYWVACNYYINTPGFNTDLVPPGTEPKTFEDLLDPKWKGKLAWNTQPSISAGQGFVGSVLIAMGEEKARAYLAKLATQNITPLKVSGRQVLDMVIAGEYPIGLQIFNNHALISAAKGAPVDWIKMQPPLVTYSVMSLLKDAPAPNAGKLLIEFIVSEEGQKIFAAAGELPVRPGVPIKDPTAIPDGKSFRGTFLTPEQLDVSLAPWTKVYDEYFH